ncbi:uncharacterized protein EAE97_002249 [Botrytis byssoidea]|uniref:Uncharacterized protein n=1 Tax=Botrytis byssoidea TaxID=139641 RepID=A0A9P5IVQ9_9HELO|nr:uncharacterized protein EAE97_002249 [Botrytis byssoidea]KAF7950697.1 hypothetical protein EAE97_002249 [Botrytis byssoidea]
MEPYIRGYWTCLECDRSENSGRPDAHTLMCRHDFCRRQADYRSAEEENSLDHTSREEKLRNEILWDGTPIGRDILRPDVPGDYWRRCFTKRHNSK